MRRCARPLFLLATLRQGLEAISIAVFVEAIYSAAMSGCFGAFVQRCVMPTRSGPPALLIVAVLPALLLWFDYLLHLYTGMSNLKGGMWAAASLSCAFIAVQLVSDEAGEVCS